MVRKISLAGDGLFMGTQIDVGIGTCYIGWQWLADGMERPPPLSSQPDCGPFLPALWSFTSEWTTIKWKLQVAEKKEKILANVDGHDCSNIQALVCVLAWKQRIYNIL